MYLLIIRSLYKTLRAAICKIVTRYQTSGNNSWLFVKSLRSQPKGELVMIGSSVYSRIFLKEKKNYMRELRSVS